MKIFAFSDLHNNFYALVEFNNYLKENYSLGDKVIFLGDVIGYLQPDIRIFNLLQGMVREFQMDLLMGNHDAAFFNHIGRTQLKVNPSPEIAKTLETNIAIKQQMDDLFPLFLKEGSLPVEFNERKLGFSHGGISDPLNDYYYPDFKFVDEHKLSFDPQTTYIFGHTHRPFVLERISNVFVNAGSIGLPRDQDFRLSFLEIKGEKVEIKRLVYPVTHTYNYNNALPEFVKNRVLFGGKSSFPGCKLLNFNDVDYDKIADRFSNCYFYQKAIYFWQNEEGYQLYKVRSCDRNQFLLRGSAFEVFLPEIEDVKRSISRGQV